MDKATFDQKNSKGEVEVVKPKPVAKESSSTATTNTATHAGSEDPRAPNFDLKHYTAILEMLRVVKQPLSVAPTNIPQNFLEGIELYENGGTRRLYLYVNKTWRYVALT